MQKHYNYLNIDLDKKIHTKLKAKQGDSKSRYILVNLISNSTYYDLSDCAVDIYGIKKDKTIFFNHATVTNAKQGQFEVELTTQALAVPGEVEIQILILGTNDEKLTTFSFFIDVKKTIIDDAAIESTNEFTALTEALSSVQNIDNRFREVDEQFNTKASKIDLEVERKRIDSFTSLTQGSTTGDAELIDARIGADSKIYKNVGSNVRNVSKGIGILSKSISPSHFSQEIREQFCQNDMINFEWNEVNGYYNNELVFVQNSGYSMTNLIPCKINDEFIAKQCVQGNLAYFAVLFDYNNSVIEVIDKGNGITTANEYTYKIQNENATYIAFCTQRRSEFFLKKISIINNTQKFTDVKNNIKEIKDIISDYAKIEYTENSVNGYYQSNGILKVVTDTNYKNTELISVTNIDKFRFQSYGIGTSAYQVVEFDINKKPLGAYLQGTGSSTSYQQNYYEIINEETKYIAFSYYKADLILEKMQYIDIKSQTSTSIDNILSNKTIVGMGDSLMYGMGLDRSKPWIALCGIKNNMNYYNCGVNGKKIAGIDGVANEFETLLSTNNVPESVDYIVVDGGANDNSNGISIGTNNDMTVDTFKGAMNVLIGKILSKYPTSKILFLTNFNRYAGDINFVDAMIEICELYSIPCFDNYRKSGINFLNPNGYHSLRNLVFEHQTYKKHFSEKGYEYLLPIYENLLKGI